MTINSIWGSMKTISAKAESIVRAPATDVFDAFVDAEKMSRFWFKRRDEGLQEGKTVSWFVGESEDAFAIEVRVKEIKEPELIRVEWGFRGRFNQVLWQIRDMQGGHSILTIEESGFEGSDDEIIASALDSAGGFGQVTIALKAYLEHDAIINVVTDHP